MSPLHLHRSSSPHVAAPIIGGLSQLRTCIVALISPSVCILWHRQSSRPPLTLPLFLQASCLPLPTHPHPSTNVITFSVLILIISIWLLGNNSPKKSTIKTSIVLWCPFAEPFTNITRTFSFFNWSHRQSRCFKNYKAKLEIAAPPGNQLAAKTLAWCICWYIHTYVCLHCVVLWVNILINVLMCCILSFYQLKNHKIKPNFTICILDLFIL